MPMMTGKQYEESLRKLNFKVYLQGEQVKNPVDHPIIRPSMNSVKATYELAEKPEIASRILVQGMKEGSFTGKKLSDYIGGGKQDFEGARRIVNGTDKAGTFAATARKILAVL